MGFRKALTELAQINPAAQLLQVENSLPVETLTHHQKKRVP